MKQVLSLGLMVLSLLSTATFAVAQDSRNTKEYNLQNGVGLKGYDPVSYFPEGGSKALVGLNQFKLNYLGVTYFFANTKNLETFSKDALKYEPSYGGYCAYAMASGSKVDIDPIFYTINERRLHFFVSNRAKRNFDAEVKTYEDRADSFWKQISGEAPRK